ncbi:tRNA wybutosine-synthesizing protein 5 [Nymphon striatum]|nr:tRNA wybutosine-synthesizing protein 5 [Nymphon striatum]
MYTCISLCRKPVILRGLNIGICKQKWSLEYLKENAEDVDVKVHVTTEPNMSFIKKNFAYRSLKFKNFLNRIIKSSNKEEFFFDQNELYYLRSLGDNARKDPADIKKQFPSLASDINFPPYFTDESFFSSVFRISSPGIRLWTHYDIMDNLLIQVTGTKDVTLFSPADSRYLYMDGDKSAVLDIENPDLYEFPKFSKAIPHKCTLLPGDVLFIPALWFHNVISHSISVAVNVFWRHLPQEMYDKKDPYGNKDLLLATESFRHLDKALKCIDSLPEPYKQFYCTRMIETCKKKLQNI